MFCLENSKEIGAYLRSQIEAKGYPSTRQFARKSGEAVTIEDRSTMIDPGRTFLSREGLIRLPRNASLLPETGSDASASQLSGRIAPFQRFQLRSVLTCGNNLI